MKHYYSLKSTAYGITDILTKKNAVLQRYASHGMNLYVYFGEIIQIAVVKRWMNLTLALKRMNFSEGILPNPTSEKVVLCLEGPVYCRWILT